MMCRKRRTGAFELPVPPQVSCPKCSCSLSRNVVQHFPPAFAPHDVTTKGYGVEARRGDGFETFGRATARQAIENRDYFRRSFLVFTLNLTIGRLAVEETRRLLRRRRRSRRASDEKK